MTPQRIQLSRRRGWEMPPNTVKVDRTTPFGNPFFKHGDGVAIEPGLAVKLFRDFLVKHQCIARTRFKPGRNPGKKQVMVIDMPQIVEVLRGKNLACWCKPGAPCHADVLLEIVNK